VTEPWALPPGLRVDEQQAWFALQAWQREFVAAGASRGRPSPTAIDPTPPVPPTVEPTGGIAVRIERSLAAIDAMFADPAVAERVRARQRRLLGHEPTPSTVGALELLTVDRIASRGAAGRTVMHAGVGGVTGSVAAGAGVAGAATGGLALGAAAGVVALAALADASFVVLQASRTTTRIATAYGFDPRRAEEQAAVLAVVATALARPRDRAAALGRSHHIAGLIMDRSARGMAADGLARGLVHQLHRGVVLSVSGHPVRRGVPVVGAVLGSAATARTARHVEQVARQLYRDRFLRRRSLLARLGQDAWVAES